MHIDGVDRHPSLEQAGDLCRVAFQRRRYHVGGGIRNRRRGRPLQCFDRRLGLGRR
jgi:hypothetical protein